MISQIAAISNNNCIGKDGDLPWDIPEDMEHFRKKTEGKVVLMGRKTWESIPEQFRPLPNRMNVILTNQQDYSVPEGVEVFNSIDKAIEAFEGEDIMVIGGESVYKNTINKAEKLYITHVDDEVENCDAFYPEIDKNVWKEETREDHNGFSFVTYERK